MLRQWRAILLLANIDRNLDNQFGDSSVHKNFRYVDDLIIFLEKQRGVIFDDSVDKMLSASQSHGIGLCFTYELPSHDSLQFLDIRLIFKEDHMCWGYNFRLQNGTMPFRLDHSKTVKQSTASLCLGSALRKSRPQTMQSSFGD